MHIALDEIDPEIAAKYTVMARPVPRVSLTPGRVALLLGSMGGAPFLGFWFADMVARNRSGSAAMFLPWLAWLMIWSGASGVGVHAALGRLTGRGTALLFAPLAFAPVMALFIAYGRLDSSTLFLPIIATIWFTVWLGCIGLASRSTLRPVRKRRQAMRLNVSEAQEVFSQIALSRAERLYCDVLLFLTRTSANADTEPLLRDMLRQLNDLVATNRELEQKRLALLPLLGNHVPAELQAEYEALEQRLARTGDPVARQSIEQSLQMCRTRLDNSRALQQGWERIQARQEAIAQTISSAQSAMARLQIVPEVQTQAVAQEITQSITQMNQQTYQVEQAVQEVIALTAQG